MPTAANRRPVEAYLLSLWGFVCGCFYLIDWCGYRAVFFDVSYSRNTLSFGVLMTRICYASNRGIL